MARLSQTEYLIVGSARDKGERVADEEARWEMDHQANYLLPRHDGHACFRLSGEHVSHVMAKLCGLNLETDGFNPGNAAPAHCAEAPKGRDIPCRAPLR